MSDDLTHDKVVVSSPYFKMGNGKMAALRCIKAGQLSQI